MSHRKYCIGFAVLLLLSASCAYLLFSDDMKERPRPRFTVGNATTYVDGPFDEVGNIDYSTALNERLSKGITPQNNANVLLWQAMGPRAGGITKLPAEFFKLMGMAAPPEKGEYIVDFASHVREALDLPQSDNDEWEAILNRVSVRSWRSEEQPEVAAWLNAMEKPLALVVEATRRPEYYSPLVPTKGENGSNGLLSSLLPGVQRCRVIAKALACRAMLHLGKGELDASWTDLIACHRLGRLVARGGCLIEMLVGIAIDSNAMKGDLEFLERAKLDSNALQKYAGEIQALPAIPAVSEKVALSERFTMLDIVMMVDRIGLHSLENLRGNAGGKNNPIDDRMMKTIDWDPALEAINQWYDRMVIVYSEKDFRARLQKHELLMTELQTIRVDAMQGDSIAQKLFSGRPTGKKLGKKVGDLFVGLLLPAVNKVADAADRREQIQNNLIIAFALARYRLDNGSYPNELAALAPKHIKDVPNDIFSGKPLIYKLEEKGYHLYSVGPNGKDDEGRGPDDTPKGDDIGVRMPLPERPKP